MTQDKNHTDYILKKEKKTIDLFNEQMINGKIFTTSFDKIDKLDESFSDFEKSVTVKTDTKFSKDSKSTEDKSTENSEVPTDEFDEEIEDEFD